jgi:hypothetical protein
MEPVPAAAIPDPVATSMPAFSCALNVQNSYFGMGHDESATAERSYPLFQPHACGWLAAAELYGVLPGGLVFDGASGQYICKSTIPIPSAYRTTTTLTATGGSYGVVTGSVC